MLIATEYSVLQQMESYSAKLIPMEKKPKRVGVLINAEEFNRTKVIRHWGTVMLMDIGHDWDWRKGQFSFWGCGRDELVDVIVVFEEEERKFCEGCGTLMFAECECQDG